jgi:hypothetical protein
MGFNSAFKRELLSLFYDVTRRILVVTDISVPSSRDKPSNKKECLSLEDGTNRLSRNVGNYYYTLRNTQEERIIPRRKSEIRHSILKSHFACTSSET